VFKAHRRVYHSTLGLRVIKKKKKHLEGGLGRAEQGQGLLLLFQRPLPRPLQFWGLRVRVKVYVL